MGSGNSRFIWTEMKCIGPGVSDWNDWGDGNVWENAWDGHHDNIGRGNWFISGLQSKHSNRKEDRRFRWKICRPMQNTVYINSNNLQTLPRTDYDARWTRECPGQSAMVGGISDHNNHREDRRWTFKCGSLNDNRQRLLLCSWTNWLNNYDARVNYVCPSNGVIRGIESIHHNHYEDRRWKFKCCMIGRDPQEELVIREEPVIIVEPCIACPQYVDPEHPNTITIVFPSPGDVASTAPCPEGHYREDEVITNPGHPGLECIPCEDGQSSNVLTIVFPSPDRASDGILSCPPGYSLMETANAKQGPFSLMGDILNSGDSILSNSNYVVMVVVAALLVINVICCLYYFCVTKRSRNKEHQYQKVSIKSDHSDVSETECE